MDAELGDGQPSREVDWEGVRLHIVTGKGGAGKTTTAAALALALASGGRRTLLIEVEGRQGISRLFDTQPLPYEERRIARARGGGEVHALAVDPEQAFYEYLEMFYKLGRAGQALRRIGAVDFVTTVAPGVRDVLLTGKACEAVRRRRGNGSPAYAAVVMDAPPTGRITRFLNVNSEVVGMARFGPIHHHAQAVMKVLRSPETAVHFVTPLEEMPVQETADGIAELRAVGLPVGGVVVTMTRPTTPAIPDGSGAPGGSGGSDAPGPAGVAEIAAALAASGLPGPRATAQDARGLAAALLEEGRENALRLAMERELRADVLRHGLPSYELPLLGDGVDLPGLYHLADLLRAGGMA
ncbi:ArsA-related P-loop ATPase [Allostreptomyces psammosilenae]|uniref:ArsA/GET3 Anion-transporting ATPase-like domain-containing protein n=1 Tax=Allostreptomyces psammosilenae TaxID=1892865 RepID=A0A852ZWH1_9ACTN|nr:ArsA-related P-loop ATPase [Allostreptomyces psammosilenae]NYI05600.1 hypothetical protein [Allostreptomyces psammosilenae]